MIVFISSPYNAVTNKIEWVRSPDGPQYAGSPLSLAGGQVMAYYKDGTASDITDSCTYDPVSYTHLTLPTILRV